MKGFSLQKSSKQRVCTEEFVITAIFFVIILFLAIVMLSWPPKTRIVPMGAGVLGLVTLAWLMVSAYRKAAKEPAEKREAKKIPWVVIGGYLLIGAVIPVAYFIGLHYATGIMMGSLSVLYGERKWWRILLVGIISGALMYYLFGETFRLFMTFR